MAMTLLSSQTADNDGSLSFTASGIDGFNSTYKLYIFKFINIHPVDDGEDFEFNGSIDAGSNYNVTKTSTYFQSLAGESAGAELGYQATRDNAQQTRHQGLSMGQGNGSDESCSGTLWLFNPSSTTYVKHWYSRVHGYKSGNDSTDGFSAGYFNTTSDIDAIQFIMQGGNIQEGTIKMYGVG